MIELFADGLANDECLRLVGEKAEQAYQCFRRQALASVIGTDLAARAVAERGGVLGLLELGVVDAQKARAAFDAADNDPSKLAASAVWSATGSEAEYRAAGYSVVHIAISAANQAAAATGDHLHEEAAQANLMRDIFGNPFRPHPDSAHWPTPVLQLSHALYDGQPCSYALHDALLETGHPDLAEHFRDPKEWHPKGCWALDLILGKS